MDASGGPRLSCTGRKTRIVEVSRDVEYRLCLFVFVEDRLDYLDFFGMRSKLFGFLIVGIAVWDPSAVPLSVVRSRQHDSSDTLRRHVALELGEDKDDLQHGFANGGAGVELLVLGDEGDAELLQLAVHLSEVEKVAADTVDLPNEEVGKFARAKTVHHPLVVGAVGVLRGIARILEYDVVVDAENHLGVCG